MSDDELDEEELEEDAEEPCVTCDAQKVVSPHIQCLNQAILSLKKTI